MNSLKPKTIDEYLDLLPEKEMIVLENLRRIIKSAAPKAEEVISYGMPAFKLNGMVAYFAAFKNHCSMFVPGVKLNAVETKKYLKTKATIQFTTDKPLPSSFVKKIIKSKVKQNEEKLLLKKFNGQKTKSIIKI